MNSLNISSRVLSPFLEQLGTGFSSDLKSLLGNDDWPGILSLKTDPRAFDDSLSYFRHACVSSLLRKNTRPVPNVDRRSASIQKWKEGERDCYRSNERLSPFLYGAFLEPNEMAILRFFRKVEKKIALWIGPTPPNLDTIQGRFGPGATFSDRGRLTTVPDKMTSKPSLTHGALWYLLPWVQTHWGRASVNLHHGQLDFVRGNRFASVPKTGLIDRAIAIEPAINVFYQLGLGRAIRDRLKANTGWSLNDAQPIHREMARSASVSKSHCTIDLSNASDTVSYNLVKLLLPTAWFEELSALRSPSTLVDGQWHRLEKFSSMGNGYTFELETLIFAALTSVLLESEGRSGILGVDFFVFGDDIIAPDDCFDSLCSVLRFCGFSLNPDKSFHGSDHFRESCGGDFFEGDDVRPLFIKDEINDPWDLFPLYNGMRLTLERLSRLDSSVDIQKGLSGVTSVMPAEILCCRGPDVLGDVVLHSPESEWKIKWKNGIRYVRALKRVDRLIPWHHWKSEIVLACAVYGYGDGERGVTPRSPFYSYKVGWVPFS